MFHGKSCIKNSAGWIKYITAFLKDLNINTDWGYLLISKPNQTCKFLWMFKNSIHIELYEKATATDEIASGLATTQEKDGVLETDEDGSYDDDSEDESSESSLSVKDGENTSDNSSNSN